LRNHFFNNVRKISHVLGKGGSRFHIPRVGFFLFLLKGYDPILIFRNGVSHHEESAAAEIAEGGSRDKEKYRKEDIHATRLFEGFLNCKGRSKHLEGGNSGVARIFLISRLKFELQTQA